MVCVGVCRFDFMEGQLIYEVGYVDYVFVMVLVGMQGVVVMDFCCCNNNNNNRVFSGYGIVEDFFVDFLLLWWL